MDWRRLNESHPMYDLALWRSLEEYSELSYDEIFRDSDVGTLGVVFGSSCYDVRIREFHGEARSIFTRNACVLFAWALSEIHPDRKFVVWNSDTERNGWGGHAALEWNDGTFLDFNGVVTSEEVVTTFASRGVVLDPEHKALDRNDFLELCVDPDYRSDPLSFVDKLEQELTKDFARELLNNL